MKLIAIEEHFLTPAILTAWKNSAIGQDGTEALDRGDLKEQLLELGQRRLARMDEGGIDVNVLSVTTPALHNLEAEESVTLARSTNDVLAATVRANPERFQGFATLPMPAPAEAATELERAVRELHLHGALLCGRTRNKNLDHPDFFPMLETAARLRAPLYIHPQIPQKPVRDALYGGFADPKIDLAFSTFGLGWHYEAGIQFLRLMLSGTLDRLPDLRIILGHWGEVVLFYLERLQGITRVAPLQRSVAEYCHDHLYITPSGMWSGSYLQRTLEVMSPDRLIFSLDDPYQYRPGRAGRTFVENAPLSNADREGFAHSNWERLVSGIVR